MATKTQHYRSAKLAKNVKRAVIYTILVIMSFIWLVPFVYLIAQSFTGNYVYTQFFPTKWSFQNYINLATIKAFPFWTWFGNTLLIALINAVLQTILTLMTSYTLSRLRFKGRQTLMKMMLILGMFPGFLSMIAVLFILKLIGLNASMFGLVIIYAAGSAMGYYISKGFFDTIPKSLDEAVLIDGGTKNTVFWKIILPLSKPIIVYTILMSFTAPWGDYMMASYVAQGDPNMWNVAVGLQQMLSRGNIETYFPTFCAGAVVTSIPIMILFFALQKYYVEGVTGGSVKG